MKANEKKDEMKKWLCFFLLFLSLIGQANAASDYIVTWNLNGNSNDNFGNPGKNYNIRFENGSAVFNGQSFISIPNRPAFLFNKGITLAGIVKPTQVKQSYIIFKGSKNADSGVFLLQINADKHFQAGIFEKTDWDVKWKPLVEYGEEVVQDKWYNVVFTYDNQFAKLYINNKQVDVNYYGKPILQDTTDITFGNRGDLARGFVGLFDKVEMINRSLNEEEVAKRYTLKSSEVYGNSVCEGYENKDNDPDDCGTRYTTRSIGDIYHSKNETIDLWKKLVWAHPGKASFEVIGKSIKGNNIYLFKFGNSSGGKFMFTAQTHGSEDCGTETGYKFIKWVMESNDTEAKRIKSNNYLLAIPVVNMDTINRQNMRRVNNDGKLVPYGVDLNRNFASGWGASWSGTSYLLDPYDYRGQGAASEPETQAVTYAMQKYKPAVFMDVHCGMQMLRYTSNGEIKDKVLQRIKEISDKTGASTLSLYQPAVAGGAGMVFGEGAAQGASSWIFEISKWEDLPLTLDGYHNKWYKQAFPVYAAMSNAVEK